MAGVAGVLGGAALAGAATSAPAGPGGGAPAFAAGTFALAGDVSELRLTLGRPADSPVRVSTPSGSGLASATDVTGTDVRLTARPTGDGAGLVVTAAGGFGSLAVSSR